MTKKQMIGKFLIILEFCGHENDFYSSLCKRYPYAEKMQKYGLQRGIRWSDARHIDTPKHYRDLYVKTEELREDLEKYATCTTARTKQGDSKLNCVKQN